MAKRIFIHAGAHRTGSSSFQQCLAENRAELEAGGFDLAYPGRDGAPGGTLRLRLPAPRHKPQANAEFTRRAGATLAKHSPDPDRALILSEENIPGRMMNFFQGKFFPVAARRMKALAAAMEARPVHLVYVVRSYEGLYASAYRKRAEDKPVVPFADLVPRFLAMDRGWPELVGIMAETLKPERLTIVDYAARGESRALLATLLGEDAPAGLREPDRVVNRSATDAAMFAIQARLKDDEALTDAERQQIIAEHADTRAPAGFAEFDQTARATLEARHARDLDRIAAMDGVNLLRSSRAKAG